MALKEDIMGTEKISKLMAKMTIPSLIAQVINILYNIVDRIHIGHIPEATADALTGVGVAFPILPRLPHAVYSCGKKYYPTIIINIQGKAISII